MTSTLVDPSQWCACGRHMIVGGTGLPRCPSCQDEWERNYKADKTRRRAPFTDQQNDCRGQE